MNIKIEPLSNYPLAIPVVAEWHFREWGHTDPGGSLAAWTTGLARQADASEVPGTLLAVSGGAPVGSVCLVRYDMSGYAPAAGLTPWLKGLYVLPSARRQNIGATLVRRCEAWAASLGHQALHLYTERGSGARSLYEHLGWQTLSTGHFEGIAVTLMKTSLPERQRYGAS